MILRRVIGLIILATLLIGGVIVYTYAKRRVSDVESTLVIREKKDIKGGR